MRGTPRRFAAIIGTIALLFLVRPAAAQRTETLVIRGHKQALRVYGTRGNRPVIVSSGDGGWIHLGPHVAEFLSTQGFFVVGFDTKAYLESFTGGAKALSPTDEPGDYRMLAEYAGRGATVKPVLIGVSEGAGLSLLAATDPATQPLIAGVLGLGLPDVNELGWRWRDAVIYVTHGVPNEPTFSAAAIADRVAPLPLAAIHSTTDEFVPLSQVQSLMARAKEPKRLWAVKASNHRFSDNQSEFDRRLLEALDWIREKTPG